MSGTLQIHSRSAGQTMAIGAAVARLARAGEVVALVGELGAGKTQFVRGMAEGLGIDPRAVSSPTYVIVQEYDSSEPGGAVLVHIDAYRVTSDEDLRSIGWETGGEGWKHGAVVVVEWAERLHEALGENVLDVFIEHAGDGRLLTISPRGAWQQRMPQLADALAGQAIGR